MEQKKSQAAVELGRRGGQRRAINLTSEQRSEIASKAAIARWNKAPEIITAKEAAEIIGVSIEKLRYWRRTKSGGPSWYKLGRIVRYDAIECRSLAMKIQGSV